LPPSVLISCTQYNTTGVDNLPKTGINFYLNL
jgi:hypothetical protein